MPIKEHGYPLKGSGHVIGICYKDYKTYVEFLITSNYFEHIKVQCDSNGIYVHGGDIIFPTGWDTEEKKDRAILKSFKPVKLESLIIKESEPVQLSLFDFIGK